MPQPQSVNVFSNDRRSSRNFEVTLSKTPCFPASNRQGSRKLRPAKAVAFSGFATQRRTEAEDYLTYEFALVEAMKGYWSSEVATAATLDRATLGAISSYATSYNSGANRNN